MERKSKKAIKFVVVSVICMIGLSSCSKDATEMHQVKETNNSSYGFTMEGVSAHDRDIYKLIDIDSSIYEWISYHDNAFLFDKEVVWNMDNAIYQISGITNNSFDVEYENGNFVHVFNVLSNGNITTFNLYNDNDELVNITVTFDSVVNFMAAVSAISQGLNAKFPWIILYGAAVLVVSAIETYQSIQCEQAIKTGVEKCTSHPHCRARKHTCSVECYTNVPNCTCNCVQYSYHG